MKSVLKRIIIGIFTVLILAAIVFYFYRMAYPPTSSQAYKDSQTQIMVVKCPNKGPQIIGGARENKYLNDQIGMMKFSDEKKAIEYLSKIKSGQSKFNGNVVAITSIKDRPLRLWIDQKLGNTEQKYSDIVLGSDCYYYVFQRIGNPVKNIVKPPITTKPKSDYSAVTKRPVKITSNAYNKLVQEAQLSQDQYMANWKHEWGKRDQQLSAERQQEQDSLAGLELLMGLAVQWYAYDQKIAPLGEFGNYPIHQIQYVRPQQRLRPTYETNELFGQTKQSPPISQTSGPLTQPPMLKKESRPVLSYEQKTAAIVGATSMGNGLGNYNNRDFIYRNGKRVDFHDGGGADIKKNSILFDKGLGDAQILGNEVLFSDGTTETILKDEIEFQNGKKCAVNEGFIKCN